MPHAGKGLYRPRLVDGIFAVVAAGSAYLLTRSLSMPMPDPSPSDGTTNGLLLVATVILVAAASCAVHAFDRKGWDDYMREIVTQSATIGMVTVLLVGAIWDVFISPNLGHARPGNMILGMVPIASLSWAIGYAFLRIRGTNT